MLRSLALATNLLYGHLKDGADFSVSRTRYPGSEPHLGELERVPSLGGQGAVRVLKSPPDPARGTGKGSCTPRTLLWAAPGRPTWGQVQRLSQSDP